MTQETPRPGTTTDPEAARLLVIEPARGALGVLARRLAEAGYRIVATHSSEAAVAELHRQPIDLVLCELRARPVDGVALTRLVRDDAQLADIPVVLIAGRSDRDGTIAALRAGADDVVAKPFHFEVLVARIARQLARAKAVRALKHDKAALDARIIAKAIENGELKDRLSALRP